MIPTELAARQDQLEARLLRLEAQMEAIQAAIAAKHPEGGEEDLPRYPTHSDVICR